MPAKPMAYLELSQPLGVGRNVAYVCILALLRRSLAMRLLVLEGLTGPKSALP
jgi:hypothetical protein